jgi:hypothetical protein
MVTELVTDGKAFGVQTRFWRKVNRQVAKSAKGRLLVKNDVSRRAVSQGAVNDARALRVGPSMQKFCIRSECETGACDHIAVR